MICATGMTRKLQWLGGCLLLLLVSAGYVNAQQPTLEERVATIQKHLAASQEALKNYEWTETTVATYKGEEKSRQQNHCSYGADGKIQKQAVGEPQAEEKGRGGLRGRKDKKNKEKVMAYMEQVKTLLASYMPPNPDQLQACKDAGKVGVEVVEPDKRVILQFRDYKQPGDTVGVEVDITTDTLLGYKVSSYIDDPDDAVILDVHFGALPDSTLYPATIEIKAEAKDVVVDIQNADYKFCGD